ncbi:MAG: cytidylate kinase [Ignavibacteriales bacterium CG_4_9_14_3_um_filter_34_10]|nr:MAG: cytidylate kinase [Ignavibacteriales bacterium CG_4_9_14_3_um_filter_34_10]
MSKNIIIAIDGPAASGKSTLAKLIAEKLNFVYMDTGAMYRAITFIAIRNGVINDINSIIAIAESIDIKLKFENGITHVFVDGEEITDFIRTPKINSKVSDISKIPDVRREMVKIQKRVGKNCSLVAEGRDITTVVFPNADIKIYMNADIDVRAERRFKELSEQNIKITLDEVKNNLKERDLIDSGREDSPLKKADDAFELDTTSISVDSELKKILSFVEQIKKT